MNSEPSRIDSLIPGEDPETRHPGDVLHWVAVYSDLLRTVPALVPSDDGGDRLRDHIERWRERLDFWKERARQVARVWPDNTTQRAS
jgi:hypothetical protein